MMLQPSPSYLPVSVCINYQSFYLLWVSRWLSPPTWPTSACELPAIRLYVWSFYSSPFPTAGVGSFSMELHFLVSPANYKKIEINAKCSSNLKMNTFAVFFFLFTFSFTVAKVWNSNSLGKPFRFLIPFDDKVLLKDYFEIFDIVLDPFPTY